MNKPTKEKKQRNIQLYTQKGKKRTKQKQIRWAI